VAVQTLLLWRGADWGAAFKLLLFLVVLLVPWVRFLRLRSQSPPGFGRYGGRDPMLWVFGGLTYVAAFAFKASTDGVAPTTSLRLCAGLLVVAGLVYAWRRVRRRRRYG
jgi:hypothetical protein